MTTTPQVNESALVKTARDLMVQRLDAAEAVRLGREAAEALRGVVISDDAGAQMVTAHLAQVLKAKKALKASKDAVLAIPKAMTAAVNEVSNPLMVTLESGEKAAKDAAQAWDGVLRKRLADEQAREAAERAALDAIARGAEDVPPPVTNEASPVERSVYTGAPRIAGGGVSVSKVHRLAAAADNMELIPVAFLTFNATAALDAYRDAVKRGEVSEPDRDKEGDAVVWMGCRFYYSVTMASRLA